VEALVKAQTDYAGCHKAGAAILLPFLVGLLLWSGWAYGVREIAQVRPVGYWVCVALAVFVMGFAALLRMLVGAFRRPS
jgi:uncharacterized membrane protein